MVDDVACKWFWQLQDDEDYEDDKIEELSATFFAVFYVDNVYLASRDATFLQRSLDILVGLFEWINFQTNTTKTHAMICTPGKIRVQLPFESYHRMQRGRVSAVKWNSHLVECRTCGKAILATFLGRHLSDVHDIYQMREVSKDCHRPRRSNYR